MTPKLQNRTIARNRAGGPSRRSGLVVNSIGVFNPKAKDASEKALRGYFDGLIASGEIDPGIDRHRADLRTPHEALAAADRFAEARVDLVVMANVAFPNGQVFLTLATHPHLARTPLAVIAEPEPAGHGMGDQRLVRRHHEQPRGPPDRPARRRPPRPVRAATVSGPTSAGFCASRQRSVFSAATCSAASATRRAAFIPPQATSWPSPTSSARASKRST